MKKILLLTLSLLFATISSSSAGASFIDSGISLTGMRDASLAWGDYDNDGNLDLAVCGSDSYITKIYRNGGGYFTDIGAHLTGVWHGSLAWGDYDNDGDLDLAVSGYSDSGPITKIYRNNGDGTFADIGVSLPGVFYGSLAWGDYDNDGNLDLAVYGDTGDSIYITKIYRNNGYGNFTDIAAGLPGVQSGSLAWGDYDNDGNLDLAVCGPGITKIYRNNGNGTFTDIAAGLPGVQSGSLAWGDYDNDGDLDLAVCGLSSDSGSITKIYRNNGNGTFTDIAAGLTGIIYGSLAWGDYDNDGDLDLAVCGYTGSPSYTNITKIYNNLETDSSGNNNPNIAPSPPTNLTYESGSTTLKWNPGSDNKTPTGGLYYNLRLGTTPGSNNIVSGCYGSPLLGNYLRPKLSGSQLGVRLGDLPDGTYYWSVQTIDTGLKASAWSTEASFSSYIFIVSASVSGGHGSVFPESQDIPYGGTATITITPDARNHIANITDNGFSATIANPYLITSVTAAHAVMVTFTVDIDIMAITTASLPGGTKGTTYSQSVSATGGVTPYTWSISVGSLPTGDPAFAINESTGVITGTPTVYGTSNFTVQVTDSQSPTPATATKALSIVINPAVPVALSITTTSLPDGTKGVVYSQTVSATGGVIPYTWSISVGTLPAGLTINASTGAITGNPTTTGTFNFTVRVTDSKSAAATKALSIVIVDPYDPNGVGGTTMADVLICYKQYLGIPTGYQPADVDGGGVTMRDVLKIYKRYLGL